MGRKIRTIEDFNLGKWINVQRVKYARGQLNREQISVLESLPDWTWNTLEAKWQKGYRETLKHGIVCKKYKTQSGFKLGSWQHQQRIYYKSKTLKKERIQKLESISGWYWSADLSTFRRKDWEKRKHG